MELDVMIDILKEENRETVNIKIKFRDEYYNVELLVAFTLQMHPMQSIHPMKKIQTAIHIHINIILDVVNQHTLRKNVIHFI